MNSRNMTLLSLSIICISLWYRPVQATNSTSNTTIAFSSECDTEKMTIYILISEISIPESDLSQYNISWNDPTCGPSEKSNETYLVLEAGYSSCGTKAVDDGDHVIFKNQVSINLNKTNAYKNDLLERIDTFATYSVECNVPQGVNVTHENGVNITKAGLVEGVSSSTDQFTVSMNLHEDAKFNASLKYPAVLDRLGRFNLEIVLDTVADLFIMPRNCYGTSTSNRDDAIREDLITDGCPNKDHVFKKETAAENGKKFRFSLNVFRFKNSNGMVYIHCSTHVCLSGSNETNCQFGCEQNKGRRRRSVEDNALTTLDNDLSKDYDIRTGLIIVTENSKNDDSARQNTQESNNAQFFQTTTNIILITIILVMLTFVCSLMVFVGLRRRRNGSRKNGSKLEMH